jgi:DNA-3-methyladenine glycosylase
MVEKPRLPGTFFNRSTLQVARDLPGARLIRVEHGGRIEGVIIEAEAYRGEEDLGCHAKAGQHAVMAGGLARQVGLCQAFAAKNS